MSQSNRLHRGMQVYQLIESRYQFLSGFRAGLLEKEERKTVVEIIQAMPRGDFTSKFLRAVYINTGDTSGEVEFWSQLVTENSADSEAVCQLSKALERNGEIDAAIELCKSRRLPEIVKELGRLMKSKGDRLAETDYWSSFEGRLPSDAVEALTSALLLENGHEAVVEFCRAQLSNRMWSSHYVYDFCASVNRTLKIEGGWDSAIRIWERLYTAHPECQEFAAPFLVEALLECDDTAHAVEVYNSSEQTCFMYHAPHWRLIRTIPERLARDGNINAAIEFLRSHLPGEFHIPIVLDELERLFQLKGPGQEALRFWRDAYLDSRIPIRSRGLIIRPLTHSFAKDYHGLTEFWRTRCRDEVLQSSENLEVLRAAIRAKKDLDFELTFWKTLTESHSGDSRLLRVLSQYGTTSHEVTNY